MSSEHPEIIIIKRYSNHEEEHHGGAWKIAFADFMTAMMAFFLVLWIINATDKNTKKVIAHYFNPVRLEEPSKANKGIQGTEQPTSKAGATADPAGREGLSDPHDVQQAPEPTRAPEPKEGIGASKSELSESSGEPAAKPPTMSEVQLFSDPYGSLNQIVQSATTPGGSDAVSRLWSGTVDAFRDPFVETPAPTAGSRLPNGERSSPPQQAATTTPPGAGPPVEKNVAASDSAATSAPGAISKAAPNIASAPPEKVASPAADPLKALKDQIGRASDGGPAVEVKVEKDGVLISLTDKLNYSMFATGSAEPQIQVIKAVAAIAKALQGRPGTIVLRGHTDGRPYKSQVYDNWRLSSARAQMVYYMLTRAGLPATRIERIEGYADHKLQDPGHPFAAANRRIEILLQEPRK